ncbi:uncharacterized protein N7511_010728 [Penicillium nucicola]|uniref:uncharacterized protein n=1 Tax=Penicillium nucicola TaxID=1850975 RepID=UPI0025451F58|nr:uncharacterized protein N7511_010728 [Penicillium nucicola]KAJ5749032.1 hypothetical protein N7511_010728 [Penicillium nucicola]
MMSDSSGSDHHDRSFEMAFDEHSSAPQLDPRVIEEIRQHKSNVHKNAPPKKTDKFDVWKRRTNSDDGEKQETGSHGDEGSPIHRTQSPARRPHHLTKEQETTTVHPERTDQGTAVQHQDQAQAHWDGCKNIDIPWHQLKILRSTGKPDPVKIQQRIGYCTAGKEIELMMNAYPILSFPTKSVYQYEINVLQTTDNPRERPAQTETDRRILRKCWNSDTRKGHIPDGIWDGGRICWSMRDFRSWVETVHFKANMTRELQTQRKVERGSAPTFKMSIRQKRKLNLGVISHWLQGNHELDEYVIEALSFLDHLLREWPTKEFAAIKRAFFFDDLGDRHALKQEFYQPLQNMGASVYRGIYQAIRPTPNGLILNVDVAHCVFYSRITLMGYLMNATGCNDFSTLIRRLRPQKDASGNLQHTALVAALSKKIFGLRVAPNYDGCPVHLKSFLVKGLIEDTPRSLQIDFVDKATGNVKTMSVEQYFRQRYNVRVTHPNMLLVEMQKDGVFYPAEFLVIKSLQRYRPKLNDAQSAQMIQWCATRPPKRLANARQSKELLNHKHDPILQQYGMVISEQMIKTKARLLPCPELQFGGNRKLNPMHNGSWDLRGKKFFKNNEKTLERWGVGYFESQRHGISQEQVITFLEQFQKTYSQMGGDITKRPVVVPLKEDVGPGVRRLYEAVVSRYPGEPQILLLIVPDKDSFVYLRIKKSCDCRYGVPSQVLQTRHCIANKPQYSANVLMKVNAKLGGITARAVPKNKSTYMRPGSMIIGADVTHPMMGVWTPSLAAMSVSSNSTGTRYMGGCECNGDRIEIIRERVVQQILRPLVSEWQATIGNGKAPDYVYYFRDGVSASEYCKVLREEIPSIRFAIAHACGLRVWPGKLVVVVANKRHHIRGFPDPNNRAASDTHGGCLPGTMIDRDVTSPSEWDFLLYTHVALQGTARPVYYHVLLNEIDGLGPNELAGMINDHCHQYIRSTTSVSVHPAIYYAHLISVRARHHEDVPVSAGPQSGPEVKMTNPKPPGPRAKKLLPIEGTSNRLALSMWYI